MNTVKDQTVLVTGANRGIGRSIVEAFLRAGAGKVYAAARNPDSLDTLVTAHGDHIIPIQIDLNDTDSIIAAAEMATDVEIVINNAGIAHAENALSDTAVTTLQKEMEINVYGLMRMAQAFAPLLKQNGGGVFVQLNSIASMKSFADFATYSASKAAAYSITQALRETLHGQGTQVISVHPGPIATDMADNLGLGEITEPAELVPQAIIAAIESGDFHTFPDTMAKQVEAAYRRFASEIVEGNLMEG